MSSANCKINRHGNLHSDGLTIPASRLEECLLEVFARSLLESWMVAAHKS
jgi:hypothetical protein